MWVLLVTSLCAVPPWAADVGLRPRKVPALRLVGDSAPANLIAIKRGRRVKLKVNGPVTLTLQIYGILKKRGRRYLGPGRAIVKLGRDKRRVEMSDEPYPSVKIKRHPLWRLTEPETVTFDLGPGRHKLVVTATRSTPLGIGLVASLGPPPQEPDPAADASEAPPPPSPPPAGEPEVAGGEPGIPSIADGGSTQPVGDGLERIDAAIDKAGAYEPPLTGGAEEDLEPEIPMAPLTETATKPEPEPSGPAFTILGQSASPVEVVEPDSVSVFNRVGAPSAAQEAGEEVFAATEAEMRLRVRGPGTMMFDVHAFRNPDQPSTLAPLVIGLLVDDVLVETRIVDQPADPRYQIPGTDHRLSERVTLKLAVEPEEHQVTLTVSDEAVLGLLVRPRFQEVGRVAEPVVLTAETARAQDLIAEAPPPLSRSRITILGGGWAPGAMRATGGVAHLEGEWGFGVGTARFGIGLASGFARAETTRTAADPRFPGGKTEITLTSSSIPITAFARWSFDAVEWLELTLTVGGGVVLGWVQTRNDTIESDSGIGVAPAGMLALTALFRVGPGGIAFRAQYIPALGLQNAVVASFTPGGAAVMAGYVVEF